MLSQFDVKKEAAQWSVPGGDGESQDSGGFGFFDEGFLADDDNDPGIADVEAAAGGFEVVADLRPLGKADVAGGGGAAVGGERGDKSGGGGCCIGNVALNF